jgi:hypothetical protein
VDVAARVPVGPVTVHAQVWYTTGDDTRRPGSTGFGTLTKDSDKLPIPNTAGSWYTRPLIAEAFAGHQTVGGPPGANSPFYADKTGTWGVGGSGIFALTPAFSLGAGAAYVGATDADGIFGESVFEIDAGLFYTINANLALQAIASYLFPDRGDDAWAGIYRLRFTF